MGDGNQAKLLEQASTALRKQLAENAELKKQLEKVRDAAQKATTLIRSLQEKNAELERRNTELVENAKVSAIGTHVQRGLELLELRPLPSL